MFRPVRTEEDVAAVAELAWRLWLPHFTPILGRETIEHIVRTVQSPEAIRAHLAEGYEYWFVEDDEGVLLGYLGYQPQPEAGVLFLSKFYLQPEVRGRGLARQILRFVEDRAAQLGLLSITLTVHPGNTTAIAAYEAMGFVKTGSLHRDIDGWEVDDLTMAKELSGQ